MTDRISVVMLTQANLVRIKVNTGYKPLSTHLGGGINTFLGWDNVVSPSDQIASPSDITLGNLFVYFC